MATGDPTATLTDPVAQGQIFTPQTWADLSAKGNRLWAILVGGTYTVKKLLVDGTGNQAASFATNATAQVNGELAIPITGGIYMRLSNGNSLAHLTYNAYWNQGDTKWYTDSGTTGMQLRFNTNGFGLYSKNTTSWLDADWALGISFNTTGGIVSTAGGYTATAGDIIATAGNITATAGAITATAGNVNARHFCCNSSTPTKVLDANAGTGATAVITGTDHGGTITLNLGTTVAAGALVAITFANAFPATVRLTLQPKDYATAQIHNKIFPSSVTGSGFSISSGGAALADMASYVWDWVAISGT